MSGWTVRVSELEGPEGLEGLSRKSQTFNLRHDVEDPTSQRELG